MFNKKERGMTLVEMLAVLFIIAIILSIVFIGYRNNQQKIILNSAALELAANIRGQQSKAGVDDSYCSNPSYRYGYGIRVFKNIPKMTFYYLLSDCDGNNVYSFGDKLTTIKFPSEVELDSATPSSLDLILVFNPPGPSLVINGGTLINQANIVIRLKSSPLIKKTITINKVGMIDVK